MEIKRTGGWFVAREAIGSHTFTGIGPDKRRAVDDLKASIYNYEINKRNGLKDSGDGINWNKPGEVGTRMAGARDNNQVLDPSLKVRRYSCPVRTKRKA